MPLPRTLRSPPVGLYAVTASPSPFSARDLGIGSEAYPEVRPSVECARPGGVAAGAGFGETATPSGPLPLNKIRAWPSDRASS